MNTIKVSEEDLDLFSGPYNLNSSNPKHAYVRIRPEGYSKHVLLHRIIAKRMFGEIPKDKVIDHKDGNPLNNSRENLRLASRAQNRANAPTKNVYKHGGRWRVFFKLDGKIVFNAHLKTKNEAIEVRNKKAREIYGEFSTEMPFE